MSSLTTPSTIIKLSQPTHPTRRLVFAAPPTWDTLAAQIATLFGIPAARAGVSYVDRDGDEVTLSTQAELADFFAHPPLALEDGVLCFVVHDLQAQSEENENEHYGEAWRGFGGRRGRHGRGIPFGFGPYRRAPGFPFRPLGHPHPHHGMHMHMPPTPPPCGPFGMMPPHHFGWGPHSHPHQRRRFPRGDRSEREEHGEGHRPRHHHQRCGPPPPDSGSEDEGTPAPSRRYPGRGGYRSTTYSPGPEAAVEGYGMEWEDVGHA